jgi:DNA-binding NtrC family response regulator
MWLARATMNRIRAGTTILLNSPDHSLAEALEARLGSLGLRTVTCEPGLSFLEVARRERPGVAVLDRVNERVEAAQMEIQLLKELWQEVRIVVVSSQPSQEDGRVVERGVFFYLAAPAMAELIRVIEAAAGISSARSAAARDGRSSNSTH